MLGVKDKGILLQIIKRCNRVIEKVSNISKTDFSLNDDIKEVVSFNLFQIGELANGLSVEFIKEYNKIPWKQIIGMRNRIVHGYDTINLEIVWNTAIESIPELKSYNLVYKINSCLENTSSQTATSICLIL